MFFRLQTPCPSKDWTNDARKLDLPVTIVKGEDNTDQPVDAISRFKAAVPHAVVRIINRAGSNELLEYFGEFLDVFENLRK